MVIITFTAQSVTVPCAPEMVKLCLDDRNEDGLDDAPVQAIVGVEHTFILKPIELGVYVLRDIFVDVPPQALDTLVVDGTPSDVRTMAQPPDDVHQEGDQRVLHPVIATHTTGQSKLTHCTGKELDDN